MQDKELAARGPAAVLLADRLWPQLALVAGLAALVSAPTLRAGFVWDDHVIVEANRQIANLSQLPAAFGSHAFAGAGDVLAGERAVEYYRPLWIVVLGLQRAASGLRPMGYHLTGMLLHALASVAVLLLGRATLERPAAALLAGLWFALHPVHVEAVAWVSASNELLSGLFGVVFFIAYVRMRRVGGGVNAWVCVLALVCALLSKETAVALPLLALLWESLPGPGEFRQRLRWPVALALIALAYVVLRSRLVQPHPETHPLAWRLLTAPRLLAEYLGLVVLPIRLRVFHLVPFVKSAFAAAFLLPLLALAAWLAVALWARRRSPMLFVGLAWVPIALLPVSGILAVPQPALLAERYLYLPSVGAALAAGALYAMAVRRASPRRELALGLAAMLVLASFGFTTVKQSRVWRDDVALMSRMVHDAPGAAMGHANLGVAFERADNLEGATREYRAAVALEPGDHMMHRNLGIALAKRNLNAEAEHELRVALALKPDYAEARGDLGWLFARQSRWDEAREAYAASLAARPGDAANMIGLAGALLKLGRLDEAEREIRAVMVAHPENATAHQTLSAIAEHAGRLDEAEREAAIARTLSPESADSHYDLGVALSRQGRTDEAGREFEAALALRPRWAKAHFNLGVMRMRQGRRAEALAQFDSTIEFAPPDTALAGRAAAARRVVAASK